MARSSDCGWSVRVLVARRADVGGAHPGHSRKPRKLGVCGPRVLPREGPGRDVLAALALVARGAVLGAALLARAGHVGGRATKLALQGRRGEMTCQAQRRE